MAAGGVGGEAAEPPAKVSGGKEGAGSPGGARGDRARGRLGGRVGASLGEGRHLLRPPAARGRAGPPGRLGPGPDRTFLFLSPGSGAGPPGGSFGLLEKLP